MTNISTIKSNIDKGEYEKLTEENETSIISVNFYEALTGLNLSEDGAEVEFMAQWSPAVKKNRSVMDRILLSNNYYQPISTAIEKLRETNREKTKIVGRIKALDSAPDLSKRTSGKITVVYLDDSDRKKQAAITLTREDYDKAIEAHRKGSYIEIVGDVHNHGKRNFHITCDSFHIIE